MRKPLFGTVLSLILFTALSLSAAEKFTVSSLEFMAPSGWKNVPVTSSMRKAQLSVPASGKESGEVVFFHFGQGGGGGVSANINRWLGQFLESKDQLQSKTEKVESNGRKITYVQARGTYKSGPPGGAFVEKPEFMLLGAIIESEAGDIFIKFTGPVSVVEGASGDFKKMVEGK